MSFVEFPPLDRRTNLIYFEFATVQRDSLLLYNPGTSSSREFFALEILGGTIQLSYDLGDGHVKLQTHKQVADGHFHSVTVRRIGNMGSLVVDNCTDIVNIGFCFSESDGIFSERTLDVGNTNMTFGGLRSLELILQHPSQIMTHDFVGCIRNIHINGILLGPSSGLAKYNVFDRCIRAALSGCNSFPCKNGGVCHDLWSDYVCECKTPFTGRNCNTEMSEELVLHFKGKDYIEYVIKERFKRDLLLKDLMDDPKQEKTTDKTLITVKFKTKEEGTLLFIQGTRGSIMLMVRDRKPVCTFIDTSGHVSEFNVELLVADGLWHILSLLSSGHNTSLSVDDNMVLNVTEQNADFRLVSLEKITLGAAPKRHTKLQQSGFSGCVEYLNVSGHTLPVSGHSLMMVAWPSLTLPQPSCSSPGVCIFSPCSDEDNFTRTCLSDCRHRRMCRPAGQDGSCICLQNVSSHFCDICTANDECSETQRKGPLWVIGVVLPLITITVVVCMFVILYRQRQCDSKLKNENLSHKTGHGTENANFCFDDNLMPNAALSTSKGKPHDQMSAFQQRSNEKFNSDAFLSCAQLMLPSELEYYEIGSVSSAFISDNSPNLSWHRHLYSAKRLKKDSNHWGDLRTLISKFKKESPREEKCPPKLQNVPTQHKQSLCKLDTEQQWQKMPCYTKEFPHPELLEPTQPLSFEEIKKLNAPPERPFSHPAHLKSEPVEFTRTTEASSECDTDSTFTCSESEFEQFSIITGKKYKHEQALPSECNIGQDGTPGNSCFELTSSSTVGRDNNKRDPFAMFEQWEKNVNVPLAFDSYAAVFEDIASIPIELSHSCDTQSDEEEII
ncbi:protocadherin Fat 4-like [Fundulus heteroclitus]|uniref:protocadherin Fat 4-like n=1 Tax=Fundulus heteroclitus TaxID=8078 RepID=UPI00165A6524|nr:protocadherin Fat 4-like [Fundulus heteroclitus]